MPRIDRLHINNFRGASTPLTMAFNPKKPLVVIFGENGTGKTTIVDALDAVGNESGGSLTTRSSTSLRTHLPTVGHKPTDLTLEVTAAGTTWTARLGAKGITTSPTPRPPIQVLRRSNLQRFIDSQPSKRYDEIQHLIGVEGVERAEEAHKRALDNARARLDDAARSYQNAEEQLDDLWQATGCPGASQEAWAAESSTTDSERLTEEIHRIQATRALLTEASRRRSEWDEAATGLDGRRREADAVARQVVDGAAIDTEAAIRLADALARVRNLLGDGAGVPGDHAHDNCPVCSQTVRIADLRADLDARLADLARFADLSRQRRTAEQRLLAAEAVAAAARQRLVAAAERLGAVVAEQPAGYAPLAVPAAALAAWRARDDNPEETAGRAVALVAAGGSSAASLQAQEETALQEISRRATIRALCQTARERKAAALEAERIVDGLGRAYAIVRGTRHAFTQGILDEVTAETNRLYARLHPGEGIAIDAIALDEKRRASIDQSMRFGDFAGVVPQAYLSEAHLDTFGFCFWLAFAKREHPDGDAVLVLDDVFSSVDAPHSGRLIDLIVEEREHFAQIIVTTHQREWRDVFRNSHGPGNLTDLIELQSWSLAGGIFSYQTPLALAELRATLETRPFNRQTAAATAGVVLEATLDRLSFIYRCPFPRTRENVYTLSELMDGTAKLVKKLELTRPNGAGTKPGDLIAEIRQCAHVRNQVGAHHNLHGMAISDPDVRNFAELVAQLVESLTCETCGQIPSKETGTHLRCSCSGVLMQPMKLVS